MSNLYGFEEVTKDLESYSKPILLLGLPGTGKRTWIEQNKPNDAFVVSTTSKKAELVQISDMLRSDMRFVWVLNIVDLRNTQYIISLFKRATNNVTILAHSDTLDMPTSLTALCSVHHTAYLKDEQMYKICEEKGLKPDEAEFAVTAANGIPGMIDKSFDLLRSRHFILDFLESVRDNDMKALIRLTSEVTTTDIELLGAILTSFKTNRWSLFTRAEVEPLNRVVGLLEACLDTYHNAHPSIRFTAICFGTLHAYHGRV